MKHPNRTAAKLNNHAHGFHCWGCDAAIVRPDKKCPVCGTRNKSNGKRRFGVSTQRRIKESEEEQ